VIALGCRSIRQHFLNQRGETLFFNANNDQDRFNFPIPREALRKVFYDELMLLGQSNSANKMHWGMNYVNHRRLEDGRFEVNFKCKDTTQCYTFDAIVAADGLHSKLRSFGVPETNEGPHALRDLGLANVYGLGRLDKMHPKDVQEHLANTEIQVGVLAYVYFLLTAVFRCSTASIDVSRNPSMQPSRCGNSIGC